MFCILIHIRSYDTTHHILEKNLKKHLFLTSMTLLFKVRDTLIGIVAMSYSVLKACVAVPMISSQHCFHEDIKSKSWRLHSILNAWNKIYRFLMCMDCTHSLKTVVYGLWTNISEWLISVALLRPGLTLTNEKLAPVLMHIDQETNCLKKSSVDSLTSWPDIVCITIETLSMSCFWSEDCQMKNHLLKVHK